jgi:hypothetical protein
MDHIEEKICARWKKVKEEKIRKNQEDLDKLDKEFLALLINYKELVAENPAVIKGFERIFT